MIAAIISAALILVILMLARTIHYLKFENEEIKDKLESESFKYFKYPDCIEYINIHRLASQSIFTEEEIINHIKSIIDDFSYLNNIKIETLIDDGMLISFCYVDNRLVEISDNLSNIINEDIEKFKNKK